MYNFLCVGGNKYGCDLFTEGSNGKIVSVDEALESDPSIPMCWAGSYKKSLLRLRHHLFCKIDSVNDKDKKKDLFIMWTNIGVLIKHANKDL